MDLFYSAVRLSLECLIHKEEELLSVSGAHIGGLKQRHLSFSPKTWVSPSSVSPRVPQFWPDNLSHIKLIVIY